MFSAISYAIPLAFESGENPTNVSIFQEITKGIRLNENKIIRTLLDVEERDEIEIKFIKAEAGEMELSHSDKALHETHSASRYPMVQLDPGCKPFPRSRKGSDQALELAV